jgi:hypothetical protein
MAFGLKLMMQGIKVLSCEPELTTIGAFSFSTVYLHPNFYYENSERNY